MVKCVVVYKGTQKIILKNTLNTQVCKSITCKSIQKDRHIVLIKFNCLNCTAFIQSAQRKHNNTTRPSKFQKVKRN